MSEGCEESEEEERTILFVIFPRNMLDRIFYAVVRDVVLVTDVLQERQCLWTERVAVLSKDLCSKHAMPLLVQLVNENAQWRTLP